MIDAPPLLQAIDVTRIYPDGQVTALNSVSMVVRRGEFVAIMGPSGSGKSTLLNLLGSLDHPTSGSILFEEQPLRRLRDAARFRARKLGFVFQSFHLIPVLTAVRNVQVPMFETRRRAAERRTRALELLEQVGMSHRADHLPRNLSVGERQRVAIARALANDPVILLADEPTGNLDSRTGQAILDLLDEQHRSGMTLVMVTHDPALAERAERVVRMEDGRLVG